MKPETTDTALWIWFMKKDKATLNQQNHTMRKDYGLSKGKWRMKKKKISECTHTYKLQVEIKYPKYVLCL